MTVVNEIVFLVVDVLLSLRLTRRHMQEEGYFLNSVCLKLIVSCNGPECRNGCNRRTPVLKLHQFSRVCKAPCKWTTQSTTWQHFNLRSVVWHFDPRATAAGASRKR
jgi:hypothetical protein